MDRLLQETPEDVKIFVDLYADLVVRINELMREKGITQKELAMRLDKQPSEISKWLRGEHNFTLRSIARLQAELGEPLLVVPTRKMKFPTRISSVQRVHAIVHVRHVEGESSVKPKTGKPLSSSKQHGKRG